MFNWVVYELLKMFGVLFVGLVLEGVEVDMRMV